MRLLRLDLERSVVVGDKWSDVALARAVGARGVLVRTGYGRSQEQAPAADLRPDAVVDTLMDAASRIPGGAGRTSAPDAPVVARRPWGGSPAVLCLACGSASLGRTSSPAS